MGTLFSRQEAAEVSVHLPEIDVQDLEEPCGLRNIGNTCYINATLQCLMRTRDLSTVLAAACEGHGSISHQRLLESYRALLLSHSPSPLRTFKKALNHRHHRYSGFRQMDSSEFFLDFLNVLMDFSPQLKQQIQHLFSIQITDIKKCTVCGKINTTKSTEITLFLPLLPAEVNFSVISGENAVDDVQIRGMESWTAADIRKYIENMPGMPPISLILASKKGVLRVISDDDTLLSLNLHSNSIYFFPKLENDILIEIIALKPGILWQNFKGFLILKRKKPLNALKLYKEIQLIVRNQFGDPGRNILVKGNVREVNCLGTLHAFLHESQSYLDGFTEEILKLEVISDGIVRDLKPKLSDLARDETEIDVNE